MEAIKIIQLVYNKNIPKLRFYPEQEEQMTAKKVYYCYSCENHSDAVRSGYINS